MDHSEFEEKLLSEEMKKDMTLEFTLPAGEWAIVIAALSTVIDLSMALGQRANGMPGNVAHIVQVSDKFRQMLSEKTRGS